jgi:biopolymer transport protein TolR
MAFTDSRGRTRTSLSEINVTPLVDVVLVLLIIFMVTAPVLQSGIDVSVPKTKVVNEITAERLVISLDRKQRVFIGNDQININDIGAKVHEKLHDPTRMQVFLRADENVPFGAVATVMDALRQAGVNDISVVTEPTQNKTK